MSSEFYKLVASRRFLFPDQFSSLEFETLEAYTVELGYNVIKGT
jgi:hypothetical protein